MKVYSLVGQSGTGKSYKAFMVARDKEIEYIIDDGLLIGGINVIAGKSAKREKTKLSSIRRALFKDEYHKESVRKAIQEINPDKILILGTSHKMINEIARVLLLPEVGETVLITEISTDKEIQLARKSRKEEGKHVIPVPTVEVKKDFSGYFIDSLKIFTKKDKILNIEEKTIIRPTFSYLGKYEISKNVLMQMVTICIMKFERVSKVSKVRIDSNPVGVIINMEMAIKIISRIDSMIIEIQKNITEEIEHMTGLNVLSVNIMVKNIVK